MSFHDYAYNEPYARCVAKNDTAAITELDHFGLGGEMPLLVKMSGKPVVAISGVGTAPALATAR